MLATRFRVGEAAAAALAACALQAARIFELRGGPSQTIRVDVVGAAASLLGFLFQRAENPAGLPAYDPARAVTGIYPTRDGGHFLLHGSFPESQARALALDPELVFLDEPTSGLDPIGAGDFDELVRTLQRTLGLTVFMVTHDLDSLHTACDRIAVLGNGKIIAAGSIADMQASQHPWLRQYFHGKRARAVMG